MIYHLNFNTLVLIMEMYELQKGTAVVLALCGRGYDIINKNGVLFADKFTF